MLFKNSTDALLFLMVMLCLATIFAFVISIVLAAPDIAMIRSAGSSGAQGKKEWTLL